MNKKNTKKFIKRMINNYIVILDSIIITITYDRLEEISWTQDKAVGLGKRIELKNREGIQIKKRWLEKLGNVSYY